MALDAKAAKRLAALARREEAAREKHYAAAEALRAEILEARKVASVREVAAAAGRSPARVDQIGRGVRGRSKAVAAASE